MTAQQDPYVRVYYRVIDDPKFRDVFDDDARLACWLRLLLIADGTYPAPAPIPQGVKRGPFQHLVTVGLIDLEPGGRYRIHGMDGERGARSRKAADAANEKWRREREAAAANAAAMQAHSGSSATAETPNMHSAPLLSAPLRSEPSRANAHAPDDAYDVMLLVENLTRSGFDYREGHRVHDTLTADVRNHGAERIASEYRAFRESSSGPVDAAQIVFGVHNALHPLTKSKPLTEAERKDAEIKAFVEKANREAAGAAS